MITSLKAFTKSAGLIARSPITKANSNDIPVLLIPHPPNFRGSNNKKKRRQSWRRASCIRCHSTVNEKRLLQRSIYRRQLLLACTSLPLQPQQMMTAAVPPPLSLTDYHKLTNAVQEAEKLKKASYGPLKLSSSNSPDDLSGVIAVPRAEELPREINETEVVTARIRRVAALKRKKEKEEQLVLQGIEITNDKPLCFHVYMRLGQERDDDEEEEYVGTFSHMPPRRKQRGCHNNKQDFHGDCHEPKRVRKCCLRLGINGIFILPHNLNAYQEETVIVKLVPVLKLDHDPIKLGSRIKTRS